MKWIIMSLLILLLFMGCKKPPSEEAQTEQTFPTQEEIDKIYAAAPVKASVQPKQARKILVFSLAWGYKHRVAPWGVIAFEAMAKKTKAFDVVVSDDVAMFESGSIMQFDAVVFNNTNEEIFLPENFKELTGEEKNKALDRDTRLKNSLVDFLAGGKGLAVFHAGVASFREWPEYGNIIGARFDNHPWNSGSTVTLKVEEPDHPLLRAFPEKNFSVTDEIYQLTGNYSREHVRVLLSIDTSKTDMTVKNIHRTDGDFAISYIKNYGQGRIFYCALGHEKQIFWDPVLLQHFMDGVQFVLGDLECDSTPSAK